MVNLSEKRMKELISKTSENLKLAGRSDETMFRKLSYLWCKRYCFSLPFCHKFTSLSISFTMKKTNIIMVFITFFLSFPIHFMYDWFPNVITSIFFPVNESVWEHMKIIYTAILFSSIVEYFLYKKAHIAVHNFLISIPIISILGILLYLLLYFPIEILFSHNFIISILLLFVIYVACQIMRSFLLQMKKIPYQAILGISLILISYVVFFFLTYYPIHSPLFLDQQTNTYGIS